jgi:Bacterial PH domain
LNGIALYFHNREAAYSWIGFLGNLPQDVVRILGPGEEVQLFIEEKIYHPRINVDSVVLTNERIILRHPHDLRLRSGFTDFSYTDVTNATLDKGVLRSSIKCQLKSTAEPLNLDNLPNSDAEKAYGVIRSNIARYQTPLAAGYATIATGVAMAPGASTGSRCPRCGQIARQGSAFCDACGSKLK